MSDWNVFDNILKKPTRIIVIFYSIQEMIFYTIFYPGNYFVWLCRAIAGVVMVSLIILLTRIKGLSNRQLSIIVPCSIAIVEIITCLIVHVDKQLYIFLMGIALLSLTYIDTVGLLVTILLTCTTYAIITMGFRIPQTGAEFHFEYDLSSVISLTTIDFLIFLLGKFSIGALDRSRRTGQTFDSILEISPNLITIVNDNAKVEYISKSLTELLKFENQQSAIGLPFTDLFSTAEQKVFFNRLLRRKCPIEETFNLDINGKRRWFIIRSAAIGGSEVARLFESVEITRIVELQLAAEAASRSKGIFLAQMSHEIRTPMNAILGVSEIQLRNKSHTPDAEEAFKQIYDSGNLLLNIINGILDFSKIEAGKLEIVPVKYDVPSLLSDAVQLNRLRYESKQIEFKLSVDENTPLELYGDELRINQILNNLLSNAFKYTDKGTIELSVYPEKGNDEDTVTLVLRISDTGQGMKEDQVKRLFDEYVRFNMETNRSIPGTGLGMSIVKRLIDMMGGQILVDSAVGKGTTFTVHLPQKSIGSSICGAEIAESLREFKFHSTPISKKTQIVYEYMPYGSVLVVDDITSNLYVAKGLLTPYGLRIETAESGIEAIEKIKSGNKYDIIFMDHMMPIMDGIETVKNIRGMGYTHTIIALTANAVVGQSDMFLANRFDGFISKPIDSRELNAVLYRFIRDKQPREVIEATRREQHEYVQNNNQMSEIKKYVVSDAENAVKTLEEVYVKLDASNTAAIDRYITAVHGIKSSLANIGETELSTAALKLEQAGDARNFAVITEETPAFLDALRFLIDKLKSSVNDEPIEISGEDTVYLHEKLLEIKTACEKFDITAAKNALGDLQQKALPRQINETLDEISVHLLHSAFKKAATAAENTAKTLTP
ncbi:MAG: response regulator [Treponema sp.]|jgi:signal transduction histidine kinase/DNA-binding response OmpR family regulator|nr:response regulator [Treponema sp.]